jgi:cob(I)alamin adenosyltransferase
MDELQSILGIIRSLIKQKEIAKILRDIQDDMRLIMREIASVEYGISSSNSVNETMITRLDGTIQKYQDQVKLPKGFITPGDDFNSAMIDLARTVTRRAERRVVAAYRVKAIQNPTVLKYLNRLSTLLYFIEIFEIKQAKNVRPKQDHIV